MVEGEGARFPGATAAAGGRRVGQVPRPQRVTNPENTLFSIKRVMGRRYEEERVQEALKVLPYRVVRADNGDAWVEVRGRRYSPPEISAFILQKMRQTAQDYLGEEGKEAVVTVSSDFTGSQ